MTFYTLTGSDRAAVNRCADDAGRLGFALQLGTLRYMGFCPDDLAAAPGEVVLFLADQLRVPPEGLPAYGRRPQTRTDHFLAVQDHLGYRKAGPRCGRRQGLGVHSRHRAPVLEYQCGGCGRVLNAWTATTLQGTHRRPGEILPILRGVATGKPTAQLARELGCDRNHLLELRHRLQEFARRWLDRNPLGDPVVEADEMYQNAGEKRRPARRPGRLAAATAPSPTTGRRSPGSSGVSRASSARRSSTAPTGPRWRT